MRIALDAMGGDRAPEQIVAGALQALELIEDDQIVLIGDEAVVRKHLGPESKWEGKISLVHAPEVVAMDDPPVEALRKKRKSSISVMAKMAADKQVDARGTACPGPLLEAKRAITALPMGGVMELLSSDQSTNKDVPRWAKKIGHEYLGTLEDAGFWRIFVKRGK